MKLPQALISGVAGAVSLNLMHECARETMPNPPRIDILGMRMIARFAKALGAEPPESLRTTALAGDLASNTLFYTSVASAGPEHAITQGALTGLAGGIGTLLLPGPLGLGGNEVNRTTQTQIMAAGMYMAAGMVAGLTYWLLAGRQDDVD